MNYSLTKKTSLQTSAWAGGTTTELAIFPTTAHYQKFNFTFRMSYATVEVESSTFTFMPGVTRHLMILKGRLEIDHTNRYKKTIEVFDSDIFSGEWPTTAKGRVTDFNLMTTGSCLGNVEAIHLPLGATHHYQVDDKNDYSGLYLLHGKLRLHAAEESFVMEEGDFLLVKHENAEVLRLEDEACSKVIAAKVSL